MNKNIRKNGLSRPFSIYQVCSWVLVAFQMISFHLTTVPLLKRDLIIASIVAVFSSFLLMAFFWKKVSSIDLSDISRYTIDTGKLCNYCLSIVNFHSKHCKICNKCVYRFDHHCAFLNTCIGRPNYKDFILLLISALIFYLFLGIFCLKNLVDYYLDRKVPSHSNPDLFNYFNFKVMIILNLSNLIIAVVIIISLSSLLAFNCYLKAKGMTTYELILSRQQRRQQPAVPKTQNESGMNRTDIENSRVVPV